MLAFACFVSSFGSPGRPRRAGPTSKTTLCEHDGQLPGECRMPVIVPDCVSLSIHTQTHTLCLCGPALANDCNKPLRNAGVEVKEVMWLWASAALALCCIPLAKQSAVDLRPDLEVPGVVESAAPSSAHHVCELVKADFFERNGFDLNLHAANSAPPAPTTQAFTSGCPSFSFVHQNHHLV